MKTYEIVKKVKITQEQVDDIVDAAFAGGIGYWVDEMKVLKEPKQKPTTLAEYLTRGGTFEIVADGEEYELTLEKILKGIELYGDFNLENYDSEDADCVVQYALFGELVYA